MSDLPDLRSDADVDALMARIRTKLSTSSLPAPSPPVASPSGSPLNDLLAAQEEQMAVLFRAVQLLADTLDDLQAETERAQKSHTSNSGSPASTTSSVRPTPRAGEAAHGAGTLRINGRRRKMQ